MAQQPEQGANTVRSPDGKWFWDGQRWVPITESPQPAPPEGPPAGPAGPIGPRPPGLYRWDGQAFRPTAGVGGGTIILLVVTAMAALLVGIGIGRAGASTPVASAPTAASTAAAAATAAPTPAPTATPTPAPTPQTLSGQGSKVLPVTLTAGRYKVAWTAQGHDNFIVDLLDDNSVNLVNEIPPAPNAGETVLTVRDSGSYTLQVQAATLTWTITLTRL